MYYAINRKAKPAEQPIKYAKSFAMLDFRR